MANSTAPWIFTARFSDSQVVRRERGPTVPAVAALAGLFSQQALEKLRTIAGAVFELAEQGEDAMNQTTDED